MPVVIFHQMYRSDFEMFLCRLERGRGEMLQFFQLLLSTISSTEVLPILKFVTSIKFSCYFCMLLFSIWYCFVSWFCFHFLLIDFRTHEAVDSLLALVTIMLMVCDVEPLQRDIANNIELANPIVIDNLSFYCR